MSDTQWPRYEVFQQDKPGKPHCNIGSVHAPDAEMALQNARDVYGRRPKNHTLWIVPVDQILSKTAEELTRSPDWADKIHSEGETAVSYAVFTKSAYRRAMTHVEYVGEVEAMTAVAAMQKAVKTYADDDPFVWWVCPASAIARTGEDDVASMFAPARDKLFRLPNQYRTVTAMRKIRQKDDESE